MSTSPPPGVAVAPIDPVGSARSLPREFLLSRGLWTDLVRLAAIALQLMAIAGVLYLWQIDNRAFRYQYALICGGFVVNHFLPQRFRLPFFALFSLGAVVSLVGAANAAYIIAVGLLLIAVANLPLPFKARVAAVAALGLTLAIIRANNYVPAMAAVWPVLGSMFMFRMMIYLHDVKTGIAPNGLWRSLAYFFMTPNACFPLFPIVDYKTFLRTYYNRDALEIYQKGLDWIVRGVIQLLIYRFIYQNLVLEPHTVADAGDLAQYLVTNFLLYLRVSGNFHLIVGLLHLFGFNLPETHHRYLLSSSFTDFWRRINIYWKDFIQKIFFYPIYFRVKKRGETFALVVATGAAFFATWLLHSYQWFWFRGSFLFTWQDTLFWVILAVGVMINVLREARTKRPRLTAAGKSTWRSDLGRAVRTIAMFTFICVLWSLWNTASLDEWLTMLSAGRNISWTDAAWIVGGLLALGVAAITMGRSTSERTDAPLQPRGQTPASEFWFDAIKTSAFAGGLLLVGLNPLWFASMPAVSNALDRLASNRLNAQDVAKLERGYYEDLIDERRFNTELAQLYMARPTMGDNVKSRRDREDGRFPTSECTPNLSLTLEGIVTSTNRWGMRDQDYTKEKPEGVYRIALVGDSNSVGHGVSDDELFEYLTEQRLNDTDQRRSGGDDQAGAAKVEIVNFAMANFGPYARLRVLQDRTLEFQPDAVLNVGVNDLEWMMRDILRCLSQGLEIPDAYVREVVAKAGVTAQTGTRVGEHLLRPHALELVRWNYGEMVRICRERGIRPIAAFIPRLDERDWEKEQLPQLIAAAREAGFTVFDLTNAYDEVQDRDTLWFRTWDAHPNARGHELIADELYKNLRPIVFSSTQQP